MSDPRSRTGARAEELVAARLQRRGWRILARNARTRHGELDIVAIDGAALVFVEVKASHEGSDFGPVRPVHAVGPNKRRRVRRLAIAWLTENRDRIPHYAEIRFDAVGVSFRRDGTLAEIEHLEGSF